MPGSGTEAPAWFHSDDELEQVLRAALGFLPAPPAIPGLADLALLGRGGQGTVYGAIQTATKRAVAVKVLHEAPGRMRTARLRFEREIELAAGLSDPRLVRVLDGGVTADGRPYVVMERVEGVPIEEAEAVTAARDAGLRRQASLPLLRLFSELCEAVDHAHRRGVIHRDIKPGNILVDASGTPRVLDFGLAKAAIENGDAFHTSTGAKFLGSLPWTSPEQADGRLDLVDTRSDVYSLGATLYHLATGSPPCAADADLRTALASVVHAAPPLPSKIHPSCDPDIEAVILRAIEKAPERRYQSAGGMALDLARIVAGEPIEARRQTAWTALARAARLHRRVMIAAILVATFAICTGAAMGLLWSRAEDESRRALFESTRARRSLDFLLDSLAAVDPSRDGAETKLADALDRASEKLDEELLGFPVEDRRALRRRLRDLYSKLGRYDRALREAELLRELPDPPPPPPGSPEERSLLNEWTLHAAALYRNGRHEEALVLYTAAHERLAASFGETDRDALGALQGTAQSFKHLRNFEMAEDIAKRIESLTRRAESVEEGLLVRASALDLLADLAERQGRLPDALAAMEESRSILIRVHGPHTLESLIASNNLGNVLLTLDQPERMIEMLGPELPGFRTRLGKDHPNVIGTEHNLGVAYIRSGRVDEAAALLESVYERRRAGLGEQHPLTLITLHELGTVAVARQDLQTYEAIVRRCKEGWRTRIETDPFSYCNSANSLGVLLRDRGDYDDSLAVFDEMLPLGARHLGSGHWALGVFESNKARCLSAMGRRQEAAQLLVEALDKVVRQLGEDHDHAVAIRKQLDDIRPVPP